MDPNLEKPCGMLQHPTAVTRGCEGDGEMARQDAFERCSIGFCRFLHEGFLTLRLKMAQKPYNLYNVVFSPKSLKR